MNDYNSLPFNGDLMLVRALTCGYDEETVIEGFYAERINPKNPKQYIPCVREKTGSDWYEVNPYAVCRNSGIRDKNGIYVYEYDLLKCKDMHGTEYGFLIWSEFYKAWVIKTSAEYGGVSDVDRYTIETVGNIILSDEDAEIIYKQDEVLKNKQTFIDNSYCPSKFKK